MNCVNEVAGGYRIGQQSIKILCYTDDEILMAHNEDDLQRLLYQFQTNAESLNMQISMEKIESWVIAKEPIRCKSDVNDKPIQQYMQCT
ncbi:hypothetical protein Trydic_g11569 [Trypoxylus dichotomus]